MIQGVDCSRWQTSMDWEKAKQQGARFAILKATEGAGYKDPKFDEFYRGAKAAGLVVGAYHFFRATTSGELQAQHIENVLGGYVLDLPVALDCEAYNGVSANLATSRLQSLVFELEGYQGYQHPMIYTSVGLWNDYILPSSLWRECPLWVANWNVSVPRLPRDWTDYYIWQTGIENGQEWGASSAGIDVNQWNEAYPFPGTTPPPPVPEQVMGYMQVLIGGKLYTGNVVLEEDK